ncbi:MAG: glutaredoxin family protein, partial [Sandaracinaceae bacterium]|nr:glutaredoxin family protein [Sandaracinaceae bacterium]
MEAAGQPVELPFALSDTSPDLLLTYADASGAHTVHRPSEVPEAAREWVRVDSLSLSPEQRPADGQVYVADLRERPADSRAARLVPRATFDAYVERASGTTGSGGGGTPVAAAGSGDIVLYGAAWCGACRQARQFFEREGIAFVDRDIERDPGARDEMNQKARAAGVPTTGIPVIDVRGTILTASTSVASGSCWPRRPAVAHSPRQRPSPSEGALGARLPRGSVSPPRRGGRTRPGGSASPASCQGPRPARRGSSFRGR